MSQRFEIAETPLVGLNVITRRPLVDDRGYFERMFCAEELALLLGERRIAQINHTLTNKRGSIRGLHFQYPPHAETKLVSCLRGEVFDVAVDLRRDSPTWLQWHAEILSGANHRTLRIPEGFAHGFQTLTDECEMLYLHTAAYEPSAEGAANALDPQLAIAWPLAAVDRSPRDASIALITSDFLGIAL